jgi:hypothetical protein
VLLIGTRQPRIVRLVRDILEAITDKDRASLLMEEGDEVRCSSCRLLGFQVYTLDNKPSDSDFHFSADVRGMSRSKVAKALLQEHRFTEITVDPVCIPDGLLSRPFFEELLPTLAQCLLDNCCVCMPPSSHTFRETCHHWSSHLTSNFILRFLRVSQTEEIRYCQATATLSLEDFGQRPHSSLLENFSLSLKEALDIAGDFQLLSLVEYHPGDNERVVFLALSKKATEIPNRYAPFELSTYDPSLSARAAGETSRLVADTVQFLNQANPRAPPS